MLVRQISFLIILETSLFFYQVNVYAQNVSQETANLLGLSLEELADVTMASSSLTEVSPEEAPAAITLITREMIDVSGARSLEEVLERFVPNLQRLTDTFGGASFGMRGISGKDKFLLRVNGRNMNHKAFYGFDSEMMLSMLGDIRHIEVIRGPGSAVYGPGAIAGVINIQTFDASNFNGVQFTARQGVLEGFSSLQLKVGHTFKNDHGIFAFYGVDRYTGAKKKHAPTRISQVVSNNAAHTDLPFSFTNHRQAYQNKLRHKFHVQYSGAENLEIWARFTAGGEQFRGDKKSYFLFDNSNSVGIAYRQLTIALDKKWKINEALQVSLLSSFDISDRIRSNEIRPRDPSISLREDEYMTRLLLNWKPSETNQLALGLEFSYDEFGKAPLFFSSDDVVPVTSNRKSWNTTMYSFFGEHQFRPNKHWRLISGMRLDLHSRIRPMFSPRVGLIYTPTEQDIFKLLLSRSVRRTSDFFSQSEFLNTQRKSRNVDKLINVELSYKRHLSRYLHVSANAIYSEQDIISFFSNQASDPLTNSRLGTTKFGNLEFELGYKKDDNWFSISHTVTELFDFNLNQRFLEEGFSGVQFTSASPFGFGGDFADGSNHTTKFFWNYSINRSLAVNLSGFAYWGYKGARDWAEYNRDVLPPLREENTTFFDDNDKAFGVSVFVNANVQYKLNKTIQLMMTGHNLLGFIDKDFNKRNSRTQLGTYTLEAPALSFTLRAQY